MVGDSLSADVAGARKSNIFAVWKPKAVLFAEARATRQAANTPNTLPIDQQIYSLEKARLEDGPPKQYLSIDSTDDDYLVAYAHSRESKWKKQRGSQTKPDMVIEHLSDLLDVFLEAGVQ
jgi:phosphoglycolate phosphatase-like HAD superfamily hydrolase